MRTISMTYLLRWVFALMIATLLVGCGGDDDDDFEIPEAEVSFYYDGSIC